MTPARRNLLSTIACVLLGAFFVLRALWKDGGVIVRNRIFATRLLEGEFLYEGGMHAPYPPSWAVGMLPLTLFPVPVCRALWALAQVLAVALAARIWIGMQREAGLPDRRLGLLYVLGLVGISRFLVRDLAGGGPAFLLFTAVLGGLALLQRGRPVLGGALIGLAAGLKLYSGLFVLFLLWKRQWRAAAAATSAIGLLFLAPLAFLDLQAYRDTYATWLGGVLHFVSTDDLHSQHTIVPFEWMNQSLRVALYRFLVASDFDHPLFVDFLRLSPATAAWILRVVSLACLAWLAWLTRRPVDLRSPRFLVEIAVVFTFAVLLSPIAWRTYFVVLLPALCLILAHVRDHWPNARWMTAGLALYFLLTVGMSQELWGDELKEVIQAYYTVTWAALLSTALLIATDAARSRSPPTES